MSTRRFVHGVPELSDEEVARASSFSISSLLGDHTPSEHAGEYERARIEESRVRLEAEWGAPASHFRHVAWELIRRGIPVRETDLPALTRGIVGVGAEHVIALLRSSEPFEYAERLFGFWPLELDRLCVATYPDGRAAYSQAVDSLPEHVRDGVRTVMVRFGDPVTRWDRDILLELAGDHCGAGIRVSDVGGPRAWSVDSLIALFGTMEELEARIPAALARQKRLDPIVHRPHLETADPKTLSMLLPKLFLDAEQKLSLMAELRDEEASFFVELAQALRDEGGEEEWEDVAILNALKRGAATDLFESIHFAALSSDHDKSVTELESHWFPVMDTVPRRTIHAALARHLEDGILSHVGRFVGRYGEPGMIRKLFEESVESSMDMHRYETLTHCVAKAGAAVLPELRETIDALSPSTARDAAIWSLLRILDGLEAIAPIDGAFLKHGWTGSHRDARTIHHVRELHERVLAKTPRAGKLPDAQLAGDVPAIIVSIAIEHDSRDRPLTLKATKALHEAIWKAAFNALGTEMRGDLIRLHDAYAFVGKLRTVSSAAMWVYRNPDPSSVTPQRLMYVFPGRSEREGAADLRTLVIAHWFLLGLAKGATKIASLLVKRGLVATSPTTAHETPTPSLEQAMNDPALRFTRRLERIVGSEQPSLETARGDVRWDDLYDARRRSLQEQIDAERCECPVCRRLS